MGVDFPDTCSLKNHGICIICPLSILLLLPSQRHLWLRHAWRRPKQRPSERLYPYELQHSRPHLMAPTTTHPKAWVLCTSATHLDFKAPKKELLYWTGLLAHQCKHPGRDKTNLKAGDTRTPTHLLASLSYWIYWRSDRQKCWSTVPAHAVGKLPCSFQPTAPIRVVLSWRLKEYFILALKGKGRWTREP